MGEKKEILHLFNMELIKEIEEFCNLNDLDIKKMVNSSLLRGFTIEKFGETPMSSKNEKKTVEVIKTVEKVVEKIVKVSDDTKVNELLKDNEFLKGETEAMANLLLIRDMEIEKLKNKSEKDIYGE